MEELVIQIFLGYGAIKDLKDRKIPVWYLILGSILALIFYKGRENRSLFLLFLSLFPGFIFIMYSLIKKEGAGMGDGILLSIMGVWLSVKIWMLWYASLILICVFSVLLLLFKRLTIRQSLPYYPFFWLAYLLYRGGYYV